jgi:ABC-2 type transport system permease protein
MQYQEQRGNQISFLLSVIQPIAYLSVISSLSGLGDTREDSRLIVGVGLLSLWTSTVWMAGGVLRREIGQGTLSANMTAVWSPYTILVGKCVASTVRSVAGIVVACAAGALLWGMHLSLSVPIVLVVILVTVASATTLGVLLACMFLTNPHAQYLSSALGYPVYILSGLVIKVSSLPSWLRPTSTLISLQWIQRLATAIPDGDSAIRPLLAATGLTVGYALIGLMIFRMMVNRARKRGTLDYR